MSIYFTKSGRNFTASRIKTCSISAAALSVLTSIMTRIQEGRLPGTGISLAHINGTYCQPSICLAAWAGNAAFTSSVVVIKMLAMSSGKT